MSDHDGDDGDDDDQIDHDDGSGSVNHYDCRACSMLSYLLLSQVYLFAFQCKGFRLPLKLTEV